MSHTVIIIAALTEKMSDPVNHMSTVNHRSVATTTATIGALEIELKPQNLYHRSSMIQDDDWGEWSCEKSPIVSLKRYANDDKNFISYGHNNQPLTIVDNYC